MLRRFGPMWAALAAVAVVGVWACGENISRDCTSDADCRAGVEFCSPTYKLCVARVDDGGTGEPDAGADAGTDACTPGVVCRAAAGDCDVVELCLPDGGCPPNAFLDAQTECRAAVTGCDLPERCTGFSAACPVNLFSTASCRASRGPCDEEEFCTGTSLTCPPDDLVDAGVLCRTASGECDLPEYCDGAQVTCPADLVAPATTLCRADAGACDVPETCDGVTKACGPDVFASTSVTCRAPMGPCDAEERCTGASVDCPTDLFLGSTVVCRPDAGVCDVAETCSGTGAMCPADQFLSLSVVCRPAAGFCDVPETCSGTQAQCPANRFVDAGVSCNGFACLICSGAGATCVTAPTTRECRPPAHLCDQAEFCDGSGSTCPNDENLNDGTVCRPADGGCDVDDSCQSGTCVRRVQQAGILCRPAAPVCDIAETCDGLNEACPPDQFRNSNYSCVGAPYTGPFKQPGVCRGPITCSPLMISCEAQYCSGTSAACNVCECTCG